MPPLTSTIGKNVRIAPTAVIDDGVIIGDNTEISDYAIIRSGTSIGANCKISPHVIIGGDPQDKSYQGEISYVRIGNNNIIREFATIHKAVGEGQATILGDNNYLMVAAHLGHNVQVGNYVTMANNTALGGYVVVEDYVTLGGGAVVHQHCRIGTHVMLSGQSGSNHDPVPYMIYMGTPAAAVSTNRHGMKKAGFDQALRSEIMRAYKIIYARRQSTPRIIERLEAELHPFPEIQHLIQFVKNSKRGIILHRLNELDNDKIF